MIYNNELTERKISSLANSKECAFRNVRAFKNVQVQFLLFLIVIRHEISDVKLITQVV